jgi:uncharacterized protein
MFKPDKFEWDEAKAASNFLKHSVAFNDAVLVFEDLARAEWDVSRPEDRESRWKVVGRVHGRLLTVVCTARGNTCRIISVRRPNRKEERIYGHRSI